MYYGTVEYITTFVLYKTKELHLPYNIPHVYNAYSDLHLKMHSGVLMIHKCVSYDTCDSRDREILIAINSLNGTVMTGNQLGDYASVNSHDGNMCYENMYINIPQ